MSTAVRVSEPAPYAPPAPITAGAPDAGAGACPSCDTRLVGDFCHACGEARPDPSRVTVRRLVRVMAHELVDVDSTSLGTFRSLITRPGELTAEYLAGRRRAWLSPLRVYLLCFAAFSILFSIHPRVDFYSAERYLNSPSGPKLRAQITQMAGEMRIEVPALVDRWSSLMEPYAGWLQLLNAILFTAACALVLRSTRRDFAQHAIFGLHVMGFAFLLSVLLWPAYFVTGLDMSAGSTAVLVVYYVAMITYLYTALRRTYDLAPKPAFWRALVLFVSTQVASVIVMILATNLALAHAAIALRR